jgi:cytochrome c1
MAILTIPVTKSKTTLEVDTANLTDEVYAEIMLQGLKVLLNRGTSKITKETYPVEADLRAAAQAKAEEQLAAVLDGTIKLTGSKAKAKESGEVMTEARRLAKNIIKDEMKRNKIKISHVEPKEITAAANELLAADPSIIETAKANLEARQATPVKVDIKALIKESPKLIKAAEDKKAKAKAERPLSAKQAGKVKPRTKPGAGATA